jgi:hypothetical protein
MVARLMMQLPARYCEAAARRVPFLKWFDFSNQAKQFWILSHSDSP